MSDLLEPNILRDRAYSGEKAGIFTYLNTLYECGLEKKAREESEILVKMGFDYAARVMANIENPEEDY